MATHEEVAEAFATRAEGDINGNNMFTRDGVLYSYGEHWPLAVWYDDIAYVNGERRSQSSSVHLGFCTRALTRAGVAFVMSNRKGVKELIG